MTTGEPYKDPLRPSLRLDGWKDIANYLGRDQRTAQRWEANDGLPVFREGGKVFAHADDLDRWRASRTIPPLPNAEPTTNGVDNGTAPSPAELPVAVPAHSFLWAAVGLVVAVILIGVAAWHYWPQGVELQDCRQITRDGREKYGGLFTDGDRIYFNELEGQKSAIVFVPVAGGSVSRLSLPFTSSEVLAISRVRHSILIWGAETNDLFELELRSSVLRRVPLPQGVTATTAAWDPAGTRIALSNKEVLTVFEPWKAVDPLQFRFPGVASVSGWDVHGARLRVEVFDLKTGVTHWSDLMTSDRTLHPLPKLSPNPTELHGTWTADGRFFVFQSQKAEQSEIWVADATQLESPKSYRLTVDDRFWRYPTVVPGSNAILAYAAQPQGQLLRLPVTSERRPKPVLPGVPAYELDYSRDGQWIAYTLFPEHTIWRCRIDGSDALRLTPSGLEVHQPHWSPDGTRIAFMGRPADGNHRRVYMVPSPGGSLDEPLPQGDDQGVPTWSSDGRSLVFGDLRTLTGFERAAIHQLDLQTRSVSTIPAPVGMWSPRMSPDGKYLAAVQYDNKSLYIRDNRRRTWRKCTTMEFVEEPAWPQDSSWIQFLGSRRYADRAIFRVSPSCEPPKPILDLSALRFLGDTWIGIAPDHSPLGLLSIPDEIYALDWRMRRLLP